MAPNARVLRCPATTMHHRISGRVAYVQWGVAYPLGGWLWSLLGGGGRLAKPKVLSSLNHSLLQYNFAPFFKVSEVKTAKSGVTSPQACGLMEQSDRKYCKIWVKLLGLGAWNNGRRFEPLTPTVTAFLHLCLAKTCKRVQDKEKTKKKNKPKTGTPHLLTTGKISHLADLVSDPVQQKHCGSNGRDPHTSGEDTWVHQKSEDRCAHRESTLLWFLNSDKLPYVLYKHRVARVSLEEQWLEESSQMVRLNFKRESLWNEREWKKKNLLDADEANDFGSKIGQDVSWRIQEACPALWPNEGQKRVLWP